MTYKQYAEDTAPAWGAEYWLRLHSVLGLFIDTLAEGIAQAVRARFIDQAPADALNHIAQERGLEPGPTETVAQFRDRLQQAFEAYLFAGTEQAILDQLAAVGFTDVTVYENEDWYPGTSEWWRFWVVFDPPHSFPEPTGAWDTSVWDAFTWDGVPDATITLMQRIIRKWKSAHSKLVAGIIVHTGSIWDHSLTWDSSTWDGKQTTFTL